MSDAMNHAMHGGEVIDDTNAHTGEWYGLMVVGGSAVVASITMPQVTNSDGIQTLTLADNAYIPGKITGITLTSGVVYMLDRAAE